MLDVSGLFDGPKVPDSELYYDDKRPDIFLILVSFSTGGWPLTWLPGL